MSKEDALIDPAEFYTTSWPGALHTMILWDAFDPAAGCVISVSLDMSDPSFPKANCIVVYASNLDVRSTYPSHGWVGAWEHFDHEGRSL